MAHALFPQTDQPFEVWASTAQGFVEKTLDKLLPAQTQEPVQLHEAMRYAVLGGGKRVRPLLTLAAGQLCGAVPESALYVGCAVEMVHAYSLVHDDMPCMDDDALRRGKPTVHIAYGEATAMLVGDALQALAFNVLAQPITGVNAQSALAMVGTLAHAAGAAGMVGGQQMDLLAENRTVSMPYLQQLHRQKTGALLAACVRMGGLCGYAYGFEPDMQHALSIYSQAIGLGFQIADDVLDATADAATLGKTPGKDAAQGKCTYVSLLGIEKAQQEAQNCLDQALAAIAPFGARAQRLNELAHYIVRRKH